MNKQEVTKQILNMWNEIDPCHVCPSPQNPTDEYHGTADATYQLLENGSSVDEIVEWTCDHFFNTNESMMNRWIDVEKLKTMLKGIKNVFD